MSKLTALTSVLFLVASSAWAQTPPATLGGTPGAPPAGDAGATGGIMDYWWIILLVVFAAAAIWYFTRSRTRV
jgi:hypothetical protein